MSIDPSLIVYLQFTNSGSDFPSFMTALITGGLALCTGLSVAWMTWRLALRREHQTFNRDVRLRSLKEMEERYVALLASIEKSKHEIVLGVDFRNTIQDQAQYTAIASLFASEAVIEKLQVVSDRLNEWATEARQGSPKEFGKTGMVMVSSIDSAHQEKAKKLYPALREALMELTKTMKSELKHMRDSINE